MGKRNILILLFCCFFAISEAFAQADFKGTPQLKSINEMLSFAKKHLKKPYRMGAQGPNAFDCSGFTTYCYKQLGIALNRTSQDQAKNGKKVGKENLKKGDLVFFKGSRGNSIGHVGIVYENKGKKGFDFIHASTSAGIKIENSEVSYYKKRYKTARRITTDKEIKKQIKGDKKSKKATSR